MGWLVISHGEQAILPRRVFQWKRAAVVNHESKARICKSPSCLYSCTIALLKCEIKGIVRYIFCSDTSSKDLLRNYTQFTNQTVYRSTENSLTLLELNIGESSSLASVSLVYDQSEYSIILKWKSNKTRYLRLNRTSSFNQWTRLAFSINQTRGVLTYSENGVIVAEMSIEREPGGISWRSVAIGRSHSLAKTRFLKSFAIRKLTIERFDDDALLFYSIHENTENGNKHVSLDVLLWSIAEYFNELSRILTSPEGESKHKPLSNLSGYILFSLACKKQRRWLKIQYDVLFRSSFICDATLWWKKNENLKERQKVFILFVLFLEFRRV